MLNIVTNNNTTNMMLVDFELERQECITLLQSPNIPVYVRDRATNRLQVIDESVVELKRQVANPHLPRPLEGGYTNDEIARMNALQTLPSSINTC